MTLREVAFPWCINRAKLPGGDTRLFRLIRQSHIVRILKEKLRRLMAQWVRRTSQDWYRASITGSDAVLCLTYYFQERHLAQIVSPPGAHEKLHRRLSKPKLAHL
jgi:hypothetical protein